MSHKSIYKSIRYQQRYSCLPFLLFDFLIFLSMLHFWPILIVLNTCTRVEIVKRITHRGYVVVEQLIDLWITSTLETHPIGCTTDVTLAQLSRARMQE